MIRHAILIVDDEPNMRESLYDILSDYGFCCDIAENGEHALQLLQQNEYSLVISDIKMPKVHGFALLKTVKERFPKTSLLLMTAFATISQAVDAIKSGAEDYITKPFDPDDLINTINRILACKADEEKSIGMSNKKTDRPSAIIGQNRKITEIYSLIKTVAPTNASVLIQGESGTGKELVADALHANSTRSNKPFIKVNCAAIPANLLESELFGHVKGAFTGAIKDKKGKFELANSGTIYLDEIGDMEISLQAKILRVLQQKEFSPVGSEDVTKTDVRIIAATNKDLHDAMNNNVFREDLYYRLNVINIVLPPLRERNDDIPLLVKHFINKISSALGKNITGISDEVMSKLMAYEWPGNIRELENVIERSIILAKHEIVETIDLPEQFHEDVTVLSSENDSFRLAKSEFEKKLLEDALQKSNGSVTRAARLLGISRHSLRYQMEKCGLRKDA
ncbi:MAG: sigma-54 dependent transcriptional regulator [Candidatus Auribacterota bacterium]|jgi:DNA-binding NtrC family response regulator|uniref:Sigma-54-dependent Fis family transcriptional regulator n=1 Tax=Candidatus Auribacter fodinae TaxID=2093366 RepID=A0A3A4R5C8_9BACT|nr:MAG: sigma-54-dependent Fis family transcriptional regulator [Candidatus Auribacter fodinae]